MINRTYHTEKRMYFNKLIIMGCETKHDYYSRPFQHSILTTKKVFPYMETPFTFYIFYKQPLLKLYLLVQIHVFDFHPQRIYLNNH